MRIPKPKSRGGHPALGTVAWLLPAALLALALWSLVIGSASLTFVQVATAIWWPDGSREALIVQQVRLPRTIAAMATGSGLAVAGALMQAITNNPLASPGLLGINAGAAFAVVLAILFLEPMASSIYIWFAFGGAASAGFIVYALASAGSNGATPVKLALAGVILSSFLASCTTIVLVFDQATLDVVRFWTVGSLSGRELSAILIPAVYIIVGLSLSLLVASEVTTLSLGPDVARSVGQDSSRWRLICGLLVVLLAGSAVAIGGPIGFVGLVIPHIVRMLVGSDYRAVLFCSAFAGAIFVLFADTITRALFTGFDIPVGVTMALVGAPFFVYLARRKSVVAA